MKIFTHTFALSIGQLSLRPARNEISVCVTLAAKPAYMVILTLFTTSAVLTAAFGRRTAVVTVVPSARPGSAGQTSGLCLDRTALAAVFSYVTGGTRKSSRAA